MKKLIAGVCFLVLFAACQPVANENTTNANKTPETKAVAPPSEADMIAKEKASWDAFKRKDADAFKKALAPEYIEITPNGPGDTAATLAAMKDVEISDLTFADWKMTQIDKDVVLLTYTTTQKGTYKGEPFDGTNRHGAAWINRNGEWLAIYFQETPVPKAPPPPPPTAASTPKASPTSSPAKVETSDDVIANEKLVWELFRTRNFDAFQPLLAPEFMEIQPTGVYDRAGTVKGVSEMDASQFDLADWKAVKFDDDAALVTYTVTMKGPKPQKDYHATIWAKRDGKWLVFHHQGTPAAPAPGASPSPVKKT
ncbi:MAG: DUF4440 domain-containing protein [Pyrinomonadaceae bacterium]